MNEILIQDLTNQYLDELLINKKSMYTIKNYQVTYNQFINLICDRLDRVCITPKEFEQQIFEFLKHLSTTYESNRTLNAKRTHLRRLIHFAFKKGYIEQRFDGNIEPLRIDEGKEKPVLKPEEIEKIEELLRKDIEYATGYDVYLKARNRFLFHTFIWTGGRIGEVAKLKWEDIDTETGKITLLGKGNKTRIIPIVDTYLIQIYKYKEILTKLTTEGINNLNADLYIFRSYHRNKRGHDIQKPMSTRAIYNILRDVFTRAGIHASITPHSLRHTLASYAIKEGVSITVLSKILGHSSVRITTEVYAHVIDERQLREEMNKVKFL